MVLFGMVLIKRVESWKKEGEAGRMLKVGGARKNFPFPKKIGMETSG
jgi:hypothetical protein